MASPAALFRTHAGSFITQSGMIFFFILREETKGTSLIWSGWIIIRSWSLISISIQLSPGSFINTGTNQGYHHSPHWTAHFSRCEVGSDECYSSQRWSKCLHNLKTLVSLFSSFSNRCWKREFSVFLLLASKSCWPSFFYKTKIKWIQNKLLRSDLFPFLEGWKFQ